MSAILRAIVSQPTGFIGTSDAMKYIRVLPAELSDLTRGSADSESESAENPPFDPVSAVAHVLPDPLTSAQVRSRDDKVRAQECAQLSPALYRAVASCHLHFYPGTMNPTPPDYRRTVHGEPMPYANAVELLGQWRDAVSDPGCWEFSVQPLSPAPAARKVGGE